MEEYDQVRRVSDTLGVFKIGVRTFRLSPSQLKKPEVLRQVINKYSDLQSSKSMDELLTSLASILNLLFALKGKAAINGNWLGENISEREAISLIKNITASIPAKIPQLEKQSWN